MSPKNSRNLLLNRLSAYSDSSRKSRLIVTYSLYLHLLLHEFAVSDCNGLYGCTQCNKSFARPRHFRTHRCVAWGDYVDISKSDVIETLEHDSGEEDTDTTADFKSVLFYFCTDFSPSYPGLQK